jgi:4-diphosphocytidyl-2-C-methyl-D-erythritol kinase
VPTKADPHAKSGSIRIFAPAKVNLYLHVTGRRDDSYHTLDSLVAFVNVGDELILTDGSTAAFRVSGPMAPALAAEAPESNLVVRAARGLAAALGRPPTAGMNLVKNLPIASGIGGGSADAAAALRGLCTLWNVQPPLETLLAIARSLGQDVPASLISAPCYFRGIGDETDPAPALPPAAVVLVNPGVALPTPGVFRARTGPFSKPARLSPSPKDFDDLVAQLADRRNDLTAPAVALVPEISKVLARLTQTDGCALARMSGSGATCFGLFPHADAAVAAAGAIRADHPRWWTATGGWHAADA